MEANINFNANDVFFTAFDRLMKAGYNHDYARAYALSILDAQKEVAIAAINNLNTRAELVCNFIEDEEFSPGAVKCSYCGEHWFPENDKSRFEYCPSCGAKVVSE